MTQAKSFRFAALALVLAALVALAWQALVLLPSVQASNNGSSPYQVVDLGTLGGNASFALAVNNRGQVTGNSRTATTTLPLVAFAWESGEMAEIGTLPGSNAFSRGYAINDRGVVVGESDNNSPKAFMWKNGQISDLGTLGGGSAVAHGINDREIVVGISSNGSASRPFVYYQGKMHDLGTIEGSDNTFGRAWGINNNGDIVGLSRAFGFTSQATLWPSPSIHPDRGVTTEPQGLGSLGDGMQFSQAYAINERAWIVGESSMGDGSYHAVLWSEGRIRDLGTMGERHSRASDINASGQIVGHVGPFYNFPTFGGSAVLWEAGEATNLNDLIPADSGWILRSAQGINDRGDIVGFGSFEGQTRAFLLTR